MRIVVCNVCFLYHNMILGLALLNDSCNRHDYMLVTSHLHIHQSTSGSSYDTDPRYACGSTDAAAAENSGGMRIVSGPLAYSRGTLYAMYKCHCIQYVTF